MDKKKKIIIISLIAAIVILTAVLIILFTGKNKYVTISFDSNGAKKVESQKIKKGETIKLPTITKKGYVFTGWYDGNKKVSKFTKYNKDTTLKAKWIGEDVKTFTIKFDSDGGSKVDDLIVECGKELTMLEKPTKEGYKFVSWVDKNETPILDKALLACEDISLKAKWEKEETVDTKKHESKTTPTTKKTEKQKSYKCPEGYELTEGNKCEIKVHVTENCPQGYFKSESRGLCYKTTEIEEYCKQNYFIIGNGQCATQPMWPSGDGNKEKCENNGFKYAENGKCYIAISSAMYRCPSGYTLRPSGWADPSQTSQACIESIATIDTCPTDYSRDGSWCYKTIDATLE